MLCVGVPIFVAVGMIIANSSLFRDDDSSVDDSANDQAVDDADASANARTERLRALQRSVSGDVAALEKIDRAQAVGLSIDDAGDLLARAEAAMAEKRFDVAASLYEQAAQRVNDVHALDRQRDAARAARDEAAQVIADSSSAADVEGLAAARRLAERRAFTAEVFFTDGRFDDAAAAWREAGELITQHITRERGMTRVAAAGARFDAALAGGPPLAVLDVAGGDPWCNVTHMLHRAQGDASDGRFDDAVALYDRAADALPAILHAVARRTLKFRTYVAGYQAAQAVMAHRDGEPFDAAHAAALAAQFETLKLPRVLIDQLPADRTVATRELGAMLLTDVPAAVERIHDAPARASFDVGKQMLILRQLLDQLTGDSINEYRELLWQRLAMLRITAAAAGYDPAMLDAFLQLERELRSDATLAIARQRLEVLARRLDHLDRAVAWMGE